VQRIRGGDQVEQQLLRQDEGRKSMQGSCRSERALYVPRSPREGGSTWPDRRQQESPLLILAENERIRPPQTGVDVKNLLAETMASVRGRRLDPRVGSVIASLGKTLLEAIKTTDLEARVEALENSKPRTQS
jgi:hypothetical protein